MAGRLSADRSLSAGAVSQHYHTVTRNLEVNPGEVVGVVRLQEPIRWVRHAPEPVLPRGQLRDVDVLAGQVPGVDVAPAD